MKIMLDCPVSQIRQLSEKHDTELWQLRTPLTKYAIDDIPYGLDNGCFSRFPERIWNRLLNEARRRPPVFVCLPDIVSDAARTLDLFDQYLGLTAGLPRALVLQDGIGRFRIPWNDVDAVFVGGSDAFKISPECLNACKVAKMLGKWVHIGRVNTPERIANWTELADSMDGSGISRFDHMLEKCLAYMKAQPGQAVLL